MTRSHKPIALTKFPSECYSLNSESAALGQPYASVGRVCGQGYQPQSRIKFLRMDIVHQLGELFLGALPTVVLILIFYFILKSLFFKPLLAVMAERDPK